MSHNLDDASTIYGADHGPAARYRSPRVDREPPDRRRNGPCTHADPAQANAGRHLTPEGNWALVAGRDFDAEFQGPRSPRNDSQHEGLERRQASAARVVTSHVSIIAGKFPKLTAELYGRKAARELQNCSFVLSDLDCLPTNFLCAVGDAAADQLAAYYLVRNSVRKHAAGLRAAHVFSTDRTFDEFVTQLVRSKDIIVSPSGQERMTLFLPIGQVALLVAFKFCPKAAARTDQRLISCIKELTFTGPDGVRLWIGGLDKVEEELGTILDSRGRADWHEVGEALVHGMNTADHITCVDRSGFCAAGDSSRIRDWSHFTSAWDAQFVQCAEGGAPRWTIMTSPISSTTLAVFSRQWRKERGGVRHRAHPLPSLNH